MHSIQFQFEVLFLFRLAFGEDDVLLFFVCYCCEVLLGFMFYVGCGVV